MSNPRQFLAMSLKTAITSIDKDILSAVTSLSLPTPKAGANDVRREMLLQKVALLGAVEGKGENSKTDMAIELAAAVKTGVLDPADKDAFDDLLKQAFEVYKAARAKTARNGGKVLTKETMTKELSILRAIAGVGSFKWDAVDVLQRGKAMIVDGKVNSKFSAYDLMARLARKAREYSNSLDGFTMTDDEILEALRDKEEAGTADPVLDHVAKLRSAIKSMTMANKGAEGGPDKFYKTNQPGLNSLTLQGLIDQLTKLTNAVDEAIKKSNKEKSDTLIQNKGAAPAPVSSDNDDDSEEDAA
jgi:hypothetical protein